jgi:N-carbamoylputrescine amidase
VDKWIAGGRAAAVVSGAFCLSSNLKGPNTESIAFGGAGWIIEPEEGSVLAVTSRDKPFLTVEIDLEHADKAKRTCPRYVSD